MRGLPSGVEGLPTGPLEKSICFFERSEETSAGHFSGNARLGASLGLTATENIWQLSDREASVKKRQKRQRSKRSSQGAPAPRASPDSGSGPREEEAESSGGTAGLEGEWEELPEIDEETKVVLLSVNPYLVHVYWGMAAHQLEELGRIFKCPGTPAQPVLRFYDITQVNFDGTNAVSWFDVEIDLRAKNWYIHLESPGKSYCVDLGLRTAKGEFHRLSRSNVAETPRAGPSDKVEEHYLLVEGDYSRVESVAAPVARAQTAKTPLGGLEEGKTTGAEVKEVLTATFFVGEERGGRVKGEEAGERRIFPTMPPEEVQRMVTDHYRQQGQERSGMASKTSGPGEAQSTGKESPDLTELSEKSFRSGISSGQE